MNDTHRRAKFASSRNFGAERVTWFVLRRVPQPCGPWLRTEPSNGRRVLAPMQQRERSMDLNTRLAGLDAALLRVKGRTGQSKREWPSAGELRDVLADLDALLATYRAELSALERRHLDRVRRTIARQILSYEPRPSIGQRLLGVWNRIEPKLRKGAAARGPG